MARDPWSWLSCRGLSHSTSRDTTRLVLLASGLLSMCGYTLLRFCSFRLRPPSILQLGSSLLVCSLLATLPFSEAIIAYVCLLSP